MAQPRPDPPKTLRASAAVAGLWPGVIGARAPTLARPALGDRVKAWLRQEVEHRRLFPWIAVAYGLGVLLFFAAEGRPGLAAPLVGMGLSVAAASALHHRVGALAGAIGLAAMFAGFATGVMRLASVEAPILERITIAAVTGFMEEVESRGGGARLTLRVRSIEGLAPERLPRRVRLTIRDGAGLAAGDFVEARARLLPLPEAARPGGYDFARDAYFRGLGAVGSVLGGVRRVTAPERPDRSLVVRSAIDRARNEATARIAGVIGGQAGAVAAALVTGKRGLIDEETNDALRAAGIYHIVSISGLHMVLAAGTIFWLVRAGLALSRTAALRWPIRKIAALAGMTGASAYCLFSGAEVATQRSLVMILVMLGAVLVDRPAISLRNLAVAALVVLALEPETILGPSFQMSFAAVGALVAAGEWWTRRRPPGEAVGPVRRALRWLWGAALGLLATTLVAGLATAPFASYHFQAANPYGILGNALALPLVSLVVMPAAVIGMLAYPFGLDRWVWELMGWSVEGVLRSATGVAELDGAALVVPAYATGTLALVSVGLVIVVLVGSPLRWLGLAPALGGLWLGTGGERPSLYVDREGVGAAVRAADGRLALVGRPSSFVADQWLRADGDDRAPDDASLRAPARCDPLGCVVTLPDGRAVAYVMERRAFAEDCRRAAILVTRLTAPADCRPPVLIDRAALRRDGATSVTIRDGALQVATVRDPARPRPWLVAAPRAGLPATAPPTLPPSTATADPAPPSSAQPEPNRSPGPQPSREPGPASRDAPPQAAPVPAPPDEEAEAILGEP